MRIKKIELNGFKSFADRTEIHLGDGMTCIVGPNGCGKSNISDAIRWVLGERSAKLLRGTRMEDVIFNGAEFRKPTGMAEVSITVDNEDHTLPIEYNEVVFSRRLYRSGQSEYFLNRTPCRLRDILDLILDTGMGSNSYSMIEQGRVDSVIQADPEERRFLIEEAAGISKYKVKKEDAVRKLERTEQNLLRIRDIVSEVQKNIQYAERQARRAERYKVQFEELKKLEIKKAFLDLSELDRQTATEKARKDELTETVGGLERELQEILKRQHDEEALLQETLKKESDESGRCFELRSEFRSLTQKQEFNRERLQGCSRRQAETEKERELLSLNLIELEREIQVKLQEERKVQEEAENTKQAVYKSQDHFDREEQILREKKAEVEETRKLLFDNASQLAHLRNELSRLHTLVETDGRNQARRQETSEKLSGEKTALARKQISYQEAIAKAIREFQEVESQRGGLTTRLLQTKKESEDLATRIHEKKLRLQEQMSRLKLLEELEETGEGTERKVLASVPRDPLRGKLVRGLREVLTIKAGYESAVEAVLGAFAQGLIAEDVKTAQELMQEMAESHMGPCGIFIRSLVKPNGRHTKKHTFTHPQVRHPLEEVVEVQSGLEPLFQPLFENVYIVENFSPDHLSELLPLAQEVTIVTKQGILLGPEARIFFRNGRLSHDQGPFQRQAEIRNFQRSTEELSREIAACCTENTEKEREVALLESQLIETEDKGHELLIQRKATESLLRGIDDRLQTLEEELRILEFEKNETSGETSQTENRAHTLEQDIQRLTVEERGLLDRQKAIEGVIQERQANRDEQIQSLARIKTLLENYNGQVHAIQAGKTLLKTQIENTKNRMDRLSQEADELVHHSRDLSTEDSKLETEREKIQAEQNAAEEVLSKTRGHKTFREENVRHRAMQATEMEDRLKELRTNLHQEELKTLDLSYRVKSLHERLQQAYGVKLTELQATDFLQPGLDSGTLDEDIRSLKEKVEAFGPVNLLAVEEYEELKHRHDFLAVQEKDLTEARESLLEAIRKINRTTKTLFADTFAKAQALFQEYYQILFSGGHAELILSEGEETEEAGVDVMVRPPGKKLQHISLLSGGEKALTAMALLFALFRIKPSPLCVLDEVDAPLDEANIDRFLNVLRTFQGSTQFLIVTHNRKTIAMGDFLYGVTMEESGISKLVSVRVAPSESKTVPSEERVVPA